MDLTAWLFLTAMPVVFFLGAAFGAATAKSRKEADDTFDLPQDNRLQL